MLAEGGVLSELPRRGEELPTVKYMCRSHEVCFYTGGMQETENLPLCKTDTIFLV
jgi:hypothetical protein